ncbi:proteasome subunit beta [Candidatus Woesearchaeota archaeon]|nr:proteasome subunit beta [Candidatus Woesearchaeota archaeon]
MDTENTVKTGTTTVGVKCKDGIVLAADKRATSGYLIAHKKVLKILEITDRIAVTTAGTVSDIQLLVKLLQAETRLKDIRTGQKSSVKEVVSLLGNMVYSNIRKFSVIPGLSHFIVGGADSHGYHLYDVGADGSILGVEDYVSSGSGSVMAYGVLEALYTSDLNAEKAAELCKKAINAAVQRDIASGNGIDIVVINRDGIKKLFSKEIIYSIE